MPNVEPNPDNFAVNPLSPADLDALSAYVDGALSPAERTAFEARLSVEPQLKAELVALQQMVSALHTLPDLRAPRDFRLTRAQVQSARRISPFPAFVSGLSAVAAALMLIAGIALLRPVSLSAPTSEMMGVAALPTQAGTVLPEATDLARSLSTDEYSLESAAPEEAEGATDVTLGALLDETGGEVGNAAGVMPAPDTAAGIADAADTAPAAQPPVAAELAAPASPEFFQFEATEELRLEESQMAQAAPTLEATRTKEGTSTPAATVRLAPTATFALQATAVLPAEAPADEVQAQLRGSSVPLSGVALIGGGLVLGLISLLIWRRARG